MSKGKDPAFLFYPQRFITETSLMDDSEIASYIRLLCFQHVYGVLTQEQFYRVCNGVEYPQILSLFVIDEHGNYYNQDLKDEMVRRREYSEAQRERANKRYKKKGASASATAPAPADAESMPRDKTETITKTTLSKDKSKESIEDPTPDPLADLYED